MENRKHLKEAKRVVIKVGSSSLTHPETGHLNFRKLEKLVRQVCDLKNSGKEVILVSSGAMAVGISDLNIGTKPEELAKKQAVAAVGQASLMMHYQKLFREYNHEVGQILMTKDVVEDFKRYHNTRNTFNALLAMNVIPIVNENDTVSTEEIEFGDNDRLSATVAILTGADLLILLSDVDGLYDGNPNQNPDRKVIEVVDKIDHRIMEMAGASNSAVGTGGMITKILAAKMATQKGIDMIIANAQTEQVIQKIYDGEVIGTIFKRNSADKE